MRTAADTCASMGSRHRAMRPAATTRRARNAARRGPGRISARTPLYLDHPQFEGFEVRQTVRRGEDAVT